MKVVAVYMRQVEVLVDLGEFDSWEKAAEAAVAKPAPPIPADAQLYLERIWKDDGNGFELVKGHEVVGLCAKCGKGIVDGCGFADCEGDNHEVRSGWVSTEHGHRTWCSQACRDADPEDPEAKAK